MKQLNQSHFMKKMMKKIYLNLTNLQESNKILKIPSQVQKNIVSILQIYLQNKLKIVTYTINK